MRRKLIVANWKMFGNLQQNAALLGTLKPALALLDNTDYVICAPHPYHQQTKDLLQGSNIAWGAQNVSRFDEGAYTGSVSANMLKDFGCTHAIIGHSERRALIYEDNITAASSFGAVISAGITPIFCVGETKQERAEGKAEAIIDSQLRAILETLGDEVFYKAVKLRAIISYEPVWAIGTGIAATPQQAQEMHNVIRNIIAERDNEVAKRVRILYGGSVNPQNALQLLVMPDIDGALVGRCSLKAEEFIAICQAANTVNKR